MITMRCEQKGYEELTVLQPHRVLISTQFMKRILAGVNQSSSHLDKH